MFCRTCFMSSGMNDLETLNIFLAVYGTCRRLPPVTATTIRYCWKETIQTHPQEHSLFEPPRHSVRTASTNFNFMSI